MTEHDSDRELLAHTRPADWFNPTPTGRYNLVVIGGGPAGLVCAAGAAGLGAKVALVEKVNLGGDCLNFGCVPSKALLACARAVANVRRTADYGIGVQGAVDVDFQAVMERMRRLRARLGLHDAAERFRQLGVDVFFGSGVFVGKDALRVDQQTLHFARAVIATGARPALPPLPGLDSVGYVTNETIFDLQALPRRLVVLGAGPIGCELAQGFCRFGSEVDVIDVLPRVLAKDEPAAADVINRRLEQEGVRFHLGIKPLRCAGHEEEKWLAIEEHGQEVRLPLDALLIAAGRLPNLENLGLDAAGVAFDKAGIQVNDFLQTTNRRIYAAGDVCSPTKFTHTAEAQARIVLRNALFFGRARVSRLVIPWCTYTDPEVAQVGLTSEEAGKRGIAIDTYRLPLDQVDRAVLDGETGGFAAIHARRGQGAIVGATIVAAHAGDIIGEVVLAMTHQLGLRALADTIHPYPTQGEILKKLGDAYQRTRLTPRRAGFLRWLLRWRR